MLENRQLNKLLKVVEQTIRVTMKLAKASVEANAATAAAKVEAARILSMKPPAMPALAAVARVVANLQKPAQERIDAARTNHQENRLPIQRTGRTINPTHRKARALAVEAEVANPSALMARLNRLQRPTMLKYRPSATTVTYQAMRQPIKPAISLLVQMKPDRAIAEEADVAVVAAVGAMPSALNQVL
jgi:hypothetical protein